MVEYSVENPLNREPPLPELVSSFFTEQGGYDRNHGPIPRIDGERHRVRVDGAVEEMLELSMAQLHHDFTQHEVICALQCAGNRRHTMRTKLKEVRGVDWGDGAVMNCSWTGPRLGDVLRRARVSISDRSNAHVAFACYATACQDDDWYGGSIELDRGLDDGAEVVLALKMNGKILSASHGYPVRIVAPGIAGARCVKWLDRITVQRGESTNYYQQHDYKVLPPEATTWEEAENFWHTVPAIQDMPINSVIADPESGKTVKLAEDGTFVVRGYALPQGRDGPVVLVELSTDGGRTWSECEITDGKEGRGKWCWVLWKATVTLEKGPSQRLLSRATDKGGNTQDSCPTWNLRGVNYNGYGESSDLNVV